LGFIVIVGCLVYITYYFASCLKSAKILLDNINSLKTLTLIPKLIYSVVNKIIKKRGGVEK
jgi:hypothetical protein